MQSTSVALSVESLGLIDGRSIRVGRRRGQAALALRLVASAALVVVPVVTAAQADTACAAGARKTPGAALATALFASAISYDRLDSAQLSKADAAALVDVATPRDSAP